ncbi:MULTISPECIES: helix-turn-helix domain-containing protein [Aeromonas]|uniref:helix-turn-helix domain-containing protein n=1 Tax=Aeromonas TaxID=642 RepID=UPI001CD437EC|nr:MULTISPECIES: helix-turn-helix transcriptional regulator [Aeromonas]EKP0308469.1 helix-turn-helix transcriptional regulator [Aeromonas veronii]UBR44016.1 helix-turn-helix transcriptional regulator [Aeromonas veronii]WFO52738.1 helix-turn-helix transcriptional regulator [Aeromonas veronii]
MNIDRADIATRLIEERARTGYSQADFARQLELSREGLRLYEMGQRGLSAEFLAKAACLGVDVQYVLTGVRSQNAAEAARATNPGIQVTQGSSANIVQFVQAGANVKFGDTINTQSHTTKITAEVKPGIEHITEEQASKLTALVKTIVELEEKHRKQPRSHRSVWAALNSHCSVTRYRLIPITSYEKAEKYLRQWIGRLTSQKNAPKVDNYEWRKRKYAYIKINCSPEWLDSYIQKRFQVDSITEVSDSDLDKLYRAVAAQKSKR